MSRVGVEIVMILQVNEIRSVLNAAIKTTSALFSKNGYFQSLFGSTHDLN